MELRQGRLGFTSTSRIAARYGVDVDTAEEALRDFEAHGWISHSSFAGSSGWSLTDAGRLENERRLATELDRAAARDTVTCTHTDFIPLNRRFGTPAPTGKSDPPEPSP